MQLEKVERPVASATGSGTAWPGSSASGSSSGTPTEISSSSLSASGLSDAITNFPRL